MVLVTRHCEAILGWTRYLRFPGVMLVVAVFCASFGSLLIGSAVRRNVISIATGTELTPADQGPSSRLGEIKSADVVSLATPSKFISDDPAVWRVANRCGINSLYAYLALLDERVDYESLLRTVPIGQDGTALLDLKQAANRYGVNVMLLKASPQSLGHLVPAIVHREDEKIVSGHYDVVLQIDDNVVTMIDGTGGAVCQIPFSEFMQTWTGYVLTREHTTSPSMLMTVSVVLLSCVAAGMLVLWMRRAAAKYAVVSPLVTEQRGVSASV